MTDSDRSRHFRLIRLETTRALFAPISLAVSLVKRLETNQAFTLGQVPAPMQTTNSSAACSGRAVANELKSVGEERMNWRRR